MDRYIDSILEAIGNTPLVKLNRYMQANSLKANIFAKVESFNPLHSVKDRAAYGMILDAEERGLIRPGGTIIEATSGNTGIGLCLVAKARGYKIILTMPESMSEERKSLLKALGAKLVLTPKEKGMNGAVEESVKIFNETENAFMPKQFENKANADMHYRTTAVEIANAIGDVNVFVAGIGTGGTFTGVTKYLKERDSGLYAVAVEPEESQLLAGKSAAGHRIQGIGANFIPSVLERDLIDEIYHIEYVNAVKAAKSLMENEGIFVGISSGAALHAATQVAMRKEFKGKNIVVVLPDSGEKYISTGMFE